jgi:hypothetical protein
VGRLAFGSACPPANLEESYAILGKSSAETFPIHFTSEVEISGERLSGIIPAFLKLKDFESMEVEELK